MIITQCFFQLWKLMWIDNKIIILAFSRVNCTHTTDIECRSALIQYTFALACNLFSMHVTNTSHRIVFNFAENVWHCFFSLLIIRRTSSGSWQKVPGLLYPCFVNLFPLIVMLVNKVVLVCWSCKPMRLTDGFQHKLPKWRSKKWLYKLNLVNLRYM